MVMTKPRDAFKNHLDKTALEVENALDALLRERLLPGETLRPNRLLAAMRHAVLGGGKRLRPLLVIETAALFRKVGDGVLRAACALECVHGYSLVHDDLPAMDDDDLRRGQPTVHKAFDEATAILAGDALLTLAFDILADKATDGDPAIRSDLVLLLARSAGLGGMVGGQMLDLAAEGRFENGDRQPRDEMAIRQLQAMKTGALIAAGVEMGARLGRAAPEALAALKIYGRALGAAFQIADDILDIEASPDEMGKATGKDASAGKGTLVELLGLEAAKVERDRLAEEAVQALGLFGEEAGILRQIAWFAVKRRS